MQIIYIIFFIITCFLFLSRLAYVFVLAVIILTVMSSATRMVFVISELLVCEFVE